MEKIKLKEKGGGKRELDQAVEKLRDQVKQTEEELVKLNKVREGLRI